MVKDEISETLRKIGLFGFGVFAITQEKIEEVAQELIEKGDLNREDGKEFVREVLQEKEEQIREIGNVLNQKIKDVVENRFATQKEIDEIRKRLEIIELGNSIEKVTDISSASEAALKYLLNQGKVVFRHEVVSVKKGYSDWYVEIKSKVFTGIIIVKPSGKVIYSDDN